MCPVVKATQKKSRGSKIAAHTSIVYIVDKQPRKKNNFVSEYNHDYTMMATRIYMMMMMLCV